MLTSTDREAGKPRLAGLVDHADSGATLVYPEPPIGAEEQRLFEIVAPKVRLRSMTEWLAGDSM